MALLKMMKGESEGRVFPLDSKETIISRSGDCGVALEDGRVSRRHARIIRSGDGFLIEDLGSKNGTKLNDKPLTGSSPLVDGDEIEVGDTRFAFFDSSTTIKGSLHISSAAAGEGGRIDPQQKYLALLKIAGALGGTVDLDEVLRKILESLFTVFPQADRGFILLREEGTDKLTLKAIQERQEGAAAPIFSRTIFDHVTREGRAVLCEDVGVDDRFGSSLSMIASEIRTLVCVPLWDHAQQPYGVLQVDTRDDRRRFDEDDLELLVAIAGPVSVAIENARLQKVAVTHAQIEQEARDARTVQLSLIPDSKPQLLGYEFWHYYEPARSVGGDYFDYRRALNLESPPGEALQCWAVAIGDVAGKGMPAALLMTRLSAEVDLLLQLEPDPARLVERLNRSLCASRTEERFISFLVAILDAERHELTIVNAGHMPPLIRRRGGKVEEVVPERSGQMLGVIDDEQYQAGRCTIEQGEVVVLYTDGITDAGLTTKGPRSGESQESFGDERLRETLARAPGDVGSTGKSIVDAICRHVAGRPQFDDMTLICFGRI